MVDIQLLNVLLILLLTAQTAKHRKDSTGLPLTTSTIKFTFLYVVRLITKASLSPAANNNTTSSKNQTIEMAFDPALLILRNTGFSSTNIARIVVERM
ncbi:unnamed protein product [Rotaria magnacalcarata]